VLPDLYEYRSERLGKQFRESLFSFTRQLILTDPQDLMPSAHVIQAHRHELEYVADLIRWRLELREQKESEWNADNRFYWCFALQGRQVPPDTEEHAAAFYERGEYERAEAVFRLLIESFPGYVEGYNYLGLIALEQRKLDEAIAQFQKTARLGRELFPAHISKKRYWSDHSTRPYIRGLRNLALTFNQAGRFEEALLMCDHLEKECADDITALWHRATVYLNTGKWGEAAECAQRLTGLYPDASLMAAFALFELGRGEEALGPFLHGALNHPRAARLLLGKRTPAPTSHDEAQDHNAGVSLLRALHAYLGSRSRALKRFFGAVVRDPGVVKLLDEVVAVVRRRNEQHPTGEREAFDRMMLLRSREFANAEAGKLQDLVNAPRSTRAVVH